MNRPFRPRHHVDPGHLLTPRLRFHELHFGQGLTPWQAVGDRDFTSAYVFCKSLPRKVLWRLFPFNLDRLSPAVEVLPRWTAQASSFVDNLDSRQLGNNHPALFPFSLNHRRFRRSEHPERVNKSPLEVLSGQRHFLGLESLGLIRSSRYSPTRQTQSSQYLRERDHSGHGPMCCVLSKTRLI